MEYIVKINYGTEKLETCIHRVMQSMSMREAMDQKERI